jgi:type II secretory pathway pseudopilin PulG
MAAHEEARRMRRVSAVQSGFSLVEALIALIVLTFGVLAAGRLVFSAASAASLARSKASAAVAAQDKIHALAELYRLSPESPELAPGDHGPEQSQVVAPATKTILNRFRITWSVAAVPDPRPGKALRAKRVTVTVVPADDQGEAHYRPMLNKTVTVAAVFSGRISP